MTALAAAFLFQDPANMANDVHLIMVANVAIAVVIVLVLLGFAVAGIVIFAQVKRIEAKVEKLTDTATKSVMPMVHKANDLFNHLEPKVRSIAADVEHISTLVRTKADEAGESFSQINTTVRTTVGKVGSTVDDINSTVKDVNGKTQAQVSRVNGIISHALTSTEEITHTVAESIRRPVRKVAATVAAVMVAVEDLGSKIPGFFSGVASRATHSAPAPKRQEPVRTRVVPVPVPVPVPEPVVVVKPVPAAGPEPEVVVSPLPESGLKSGKL